MKFKKVSVLAGFLFLFALTSSKLFAGDFNQANQLYREGKFQEASKLYENLALKNSTNPTFQFDLANAYYRVGNIGKSILAYERAKSLSPRDRDIRHNLAYVTSQLEYRIKDKRNWYIQFGEKVLSYFTIQEILLVLMLVYAFFMISWIFTAIFRRGLEWGWFRQILLTLLVISGVLYVAKHIQTNIIRDAVVIVKEGEVHYGPSDGEQIALRLREGLKVYVVDQKDHWSRVWLTNGESGWMSNDQLDEVRIK